MSKQHMAILLTLPEIAQRWKVSVKSVRRLIEAKHFTVVRIGKSVRVSEAEVARYERQRSS